MPANMCGSIPATFNSIVQMFSSEYELYRTFCPHPHEPGAFAGFTNEAFDTGKVVVLNMPLRKYPDAGRTIATLLKLDFQRGVLRRTEGRSEAEVTRPVFLLIRTTSRLPRNWGTRCIWTKAGKTSPSTST